MPNGNLEITAAEFEKLLSAACPEAALLYLYRKAGKPEAQAQQALHLSETAFGKAEEVLAALGLTVQRDVYLPSSELPEYAPQEVTTEFAHNEAFSGMAQNLLGLVFRTVLLLSARFPKLKSPVVMSLIAAAMAVASVLTYSGSPVALLPVLGNFVCLGAMWSDDANVIRFSQLICVSPSWLLYNVFMVSIAGIILESFNIISIIIYYIRRRLEARRSVGKEAADWEAALAEVNADAVTAEAVTVAEAVVRDETVAAAETGAHAEAVGLAETVAPA